MAADWPLRLSPNTFGSMTPRERSGDGLLGPQQTTRPTAPAGGMMRAFPTMG